MIYIIHNIYIYGIWTDLFSGKLATFKGVDIGRKDTYIDVMG